MRLLVIGAAGMLGHDVLRAGERAGYELVGVDLPEIDITDPAAVDALLERVQGEAGGLDGVVNCAAWTDVDGAESNEETARAVNAHGAGNLARASAAAGVGMVHISTDYVFDGTAPLDADGRPRAYVESDPTGPRSVYGRTKLEGEEQVSAASPRHTIVRTAWLYGVDGQNFVETMLRAGVRARGGAGRDRPDRLAHLVGAPRAGRARAAAAAGLRAGAPDRRGRTCPGTASRRRSFARPRCSAGSSLPAASRWRARRPARRGRRWSPNATTSCGCRRGRTVWLDIWPPGMG